MSMTSDDGEKNDQDEAESDEDTNDTYEWTENDAASDNEEKNDESDDASDEGDDMVTSILNESDVEKIVGMRRRDGEIEYRLKWSGYSKNKYTWERADDVNCPDLVEKFHAKNDAKGKKVAKEVEKRGKTIVT